MTLIYYHRNTSSMVMCIRFFVSLLLIESTVFSWDTPPKLILISMDGLMFRDIDESPADTVENFQYIIENGVLLRRLQNVFPSSSFPNHYSMLTGLYPESHGIVDNLFYDPDLNDYFVYSSVDGNINSKWYDVGAEPIYVTNKKAGGTRRSGSVLFPTSYAAVKGVSPDETMNFVSVIIGNVTDTKRVDQLIGWFTDNDNPINLGLIHFPEPYLVAQQFGPYTNEVKDELTGPLNSALGYLLQELQRNNLLNSTNIILTAGHGATLRRGFVQLDDYINPNTYTTGGRESDDIVTGIIPEAGFEDEIVKNLTGVAGIKVYKKGDPELVALNYTSNNRIAPILVIANKGFVIVRNQLVEDSYPNVGLTGYDPAQYPEMRPVFMATGPAFQKNFKVTTTFSILDLYPLMCHILEIQPAPNDGSLDNVREFLTEMSRSDMNGQGREVVSVTLVFAVLLMLAML